MKIFRVKFEKNPKRLRLIITIVITVFLFGLVGWLFYRDWKLELSTVELLPKEESIQNKVLYVIDKGDGKVSHYQMVPFDDSTVFSLLEELAKENNFPIETTFYPGVGVFIESIDGVKGGTDNKWWQYWVNNKLGEVAVDKKEVKPGDEVEWRFDVPFF